MLIFDIETNGLLHNVTTIHCLVIYDTETEQTLVYNDEGGSAEPPPGTPEPLPGTPASPPGCGLLLNSA